MSMQYEAKKFNIPEINGVSKKQIDEHLNLYQGYVKHVNAIKNTVKSLIKDDREKNQYVISEMWRRFGFEFNGMRLHEYYFGSLEGEKTSFNPDSVFGRKIINQYDSYEDFDEILKNVCMTRGSGWAVLYYDKKVDWFIVNWADEHHIGHLSTLPAVLAIDCWEHAYMVDYLPSERKKYIDAYMNAVNFDTVDSWFREVAGE